MKRPKPADSPFNRRPASSAAPTPAARSLRQQHLALRRLARRARARRQGAPYGRSRPFVGGH